MARDRVLLRVEAEGYRYRDLLEARPGSVRLLHPTEGSRRLVKLITTLLALAYLFLVNVALLPLLSGLSLAGVSQIVLLVVIATYLVLMFGGMVAVALWWEDRALPLLAEHPARAMEVRVLGSTSYGTFQEVRAATPQGEVRLTVEGSSERLADALRFAAGKPTLA